MEEGKLSPIENVWYEEPQRHGRLEGIRRGMSMFDRKQRRWKPGLRRMVALYQPARHERLEKYPMLTLSGELIAQTKQQFGRDYHPKLSRSARYFGPLLETRAGQTISGLDLYDYITEQHPSYRFKEPIGALQAWHEKRHATDQGPGALQTRWTAVRPIRPEERFRVRQTGPHLFKLVPEVNP